ncbi:MAG: hypothetical protein ACRD0N_11825 [Acidimicrobiales bacterium]
MPGSEKGSFWATTSGLTTGIAGTLTGVLGIVALANQAGWIGGDGNGDQSSTAATEPAAGTTSTTTDEGSDEPSSTTEGRASPSELAEDPVYSVSPSSVRFTALGTRTATVEVRNTGDVEVDVQNVSVDGSDAGRFSIDATPCTSAAVEPDSSCDVEVTFSPGQGGGTAEATMAIEVSGAGSRKVPLAGEAGLL